MNLYGFVVVIVATLIVLCDLLVRPSSSMSGALSHPAMVAIGQRSYGLYLYHWPIFLFLGIDTRPQVLAMAFGVTFVVAWLSYAYIEMPFLRMKRYWAAEKAPSLI